MAQHHQSTFVRLVEEAISLAQRRVTQALASGEPQWRVDKYETVARNFKIISETVKSGQWPAHAGAGLGVTRALSEWGLDDDELYAAVNAAEDHHIQFGSA